MSISKKISIIGTVGLPAKYGGFETLVENLVRHHHRRNLSDKVTVYCSSKNCQERNTHFLSAHLLYIPLKANGLQSIPYDIISLFSAIWKRTDTILLLGVSGAIALPLVPLLSSARIITNIDGIEWKRNKWKGLAKWFLRLSERIAVRYSHEVIADNGGIAAHVARTYNCACHVIAYGGDHAVQASPKPYAGRALSRRYALALCRIEPENNVSMILEAFARSPDTPLVFVGNWNNSPFGQDLKRRYASVPHLYLLDPIYDLGVLRTVRRNASLYVHGHSAGGTNPSLVEMMHFGLPVLAYDCVFNRFTTEDKALFFADADELYSAVQALTPSMADEVGGEMRRIAQQRYTWDVIGQQYYKLLS